MAAEGVRAPEDVPNCWASEPIRENSARSSGLLIFVLEGIPSPFKRVAISGLNSISYLVEAGGVVVGSFAMFFSREFVLISKCFY
jgi:hypothetical protein